MARSNITLCILLALAIMLLSSCKRDLLMVSTYNYTDYDCVLEIASGDDRFEIHSKTETRRDDLLTRKCSYDSIFVRLIVDGETKDKKTGHRFEQIIGGRLNTEKEDGCMTLIEILPDEHGEPYLSIGTNFSEPTLGYFLEEDVD